MDPSLYLFLKWRIVPVNDQMYKLFIWCFPSWKIHIDYYHSLLYVFPRLTCQPAKRPTEGPDRKQIVYRLAGQGRLGFPKAVNQY